MKFGRGATALAWLVAVGCGTSSNEAPPDNARDNAPDSSTPPSDVDAGIADAAHEPTPAPPPPITGIPVDGIFVSTSKGNDAADATKLRPVKTIARAIQIAQEPARKGQAVIVCANETYTESVTLTDGLALYGYYDCSLPEWNKSSDKLAVIKSPTSPAILADSLADTRIEGFMVSPDQGTGSPGASSFGMVVLNTTKVTVAEMAIAAANGQDGIDGVESATANGFVNASAANGAPAEGKVQRSCGPAFCNFDVKDPLLNVYLSVGGSKGGTGTCAGGGSTNPGGRGGEGRLEYNGDYVVDVNDLNRRANCYPPALPEAGTPGARGVFGTNGTWSFSETGFVSGNGTPGQTGQPGMGGRGGAGTCTFTTMPPKDGTYWRSGTGGGGGAGGCGGYAGAPGTGGGASVGLFVVNSGVTLMHVNLHAAKGGRGGTGAAGADGAAGGTGTSTIVVQPDRGALGEPGGRGGKGGQSGHGAPGPSIALVYHGARPMTQGGGVLSVDAAGEAAPAITDGAQTLPSPDRVAKAEHQF